MGLARCKWYSYFQAVTTKWSPFIFAPTTRKWPLTRRTIRRALFGRKLTQNSQPRGRPKRRTAQRGAPICDVRVNKIRVQTCFYALSNVHRRHNLRSTYCRRIKSSPILLPGLIFQNLSSDFFVFSSSATHVWLFPVYLPFRRASRANHRVLQKIIFQSKNCFFNKIYNILKF